MIEGSFSVFVIVLLNIWIVAYNDISICLKINVPASQSPICECFSS